MAIQTHRVLRALIHDGELYDPEAMPGVTVDLDETAYAALPDGVVAAAETPPPAGNTPPPAGDIPPPAGNTPPPAGNTPPPAGDTPPPKDKK